MSRLHRSFLASDSQWLDDRVTLDERESHHLAKVLRAREGDEVEVFDGRGEIHRCRLIGISANRVELKSTDKKFVEPACPSFVLAVAVPKGKKMDEIVRQAGEMGATRVVPLVTDRSEGSTDPGRWESKRERWRIGAIEACKQSGNAYLPEIAPFCALPDWLSSLSGGTFKILASLESDALPLRNWLDKGRAKEIPDEVALLVGPEGDLTPEEYASARTADFLPCNFGANVLRVDTAAVCAFAVAKEEFRAYLATQPTNHPDN
ncbi:MAG: RsmE family RNA methyltransferase [Opitutales bacterium]